MAEILDLAIIGSGPAALSAAIYAGRAKLKTVVFERELIGGKLEVIHHIENYPGFIGSGKELAEKMREGANRYGVSFQYGECTSVAKKNGLFELRIDEEIAKAKKVLIASGTEYKKLGVPGENLPQVSYCATCDAPLTKGKDVIIVGGGNSAVQECFSVLEYCNSVTLLSHSKLKCDTSLRDRLEEDSRVKIVEDFEIIKIEKENEYNLKVISKDGKSFSGAYVFVFIGNQPATSFLPKEILAEDGGIKVDENGESTIAGLFAAGDCIHGAVKQVITAAGMGAAAVVKIKKDLKQ